MNRDAAGAGIGSFSEFESLGDLLDERQVLLPGRAPQAEHEGFISAYSEVLPPPANATSARVKPSQP